MRALAPPARAAAAGAGAGAPPPPRERFELRVCTNKTCRSQGAARIEQFARGLALDTVAVEAVGCLGGCGAGPNAALVSRSNPAAPPLLLSRMASPKRLAEALEALCGVTIDAAYLAATELRLRGNDAAAAGRPERAAELYTEALALGAPGTRHLLLANRSGARLAGGDAAGAAEDASAAVAAAPAEFTAAAVRRADALFALGRPAEAAAALEAGAARHPPWRTSAEFRDLAAAVAKAAAAA
jgi:hypothetical protein